MTLRVSLPRRTVPAFVVGDRVWHQSRGKGTVLDLFDVINDDTGDCLVLASIKFDDFPYTVETYPSDGSCDGFGYGRELWRLEGVLAW